MTSQLCHVRTPLWGITAYSRLESKVRRTSVFRHTHTRWCKVVMGPNASKGSGSSAGQRGLKELQGKWTQLKHMVDLPTRAQGYSMSMGGEVWRLMTPNKKLVLGCLPWLINMEWASVVGVLALEQDPQKQSKVSFLGTPGIIRYN